MRYRLTRAQHEPPPFIKINGEFFKTDTSGFTTIKGLSPSDYSIVISKRGYKNEIRKINLNPNKTETIEVEMYLKDKSYQASKVDSNDDNIIHKKLDTSYLIGRTCGSMLFSYYAARMILLVLNIILQ